MRFDNIWMQSWQLEMLAQLATDSWDDGEAIEIGVYQGLSAISIAKAIYPKTLHAVDHWNGSTDFTQEMIDQDNFDIFIKNITDVEAVPNNITIHRQDWRDFALHWTDPIRFLHLDAEHTKDEVSAQVSAFLPYMAKGSILAGDDFNWPGVREGIFASGRFMPREIHVMHNKLWWVEF